MSSSSFENNFKVLPSPTCCLVLGMAGSGKTTLMQRIKSFSIENKIKSYMVNLDPAVREVPYKRNIDIRDSVDYKGVIETYNLGPNGAILTALNLFASKFGSVLELLEKRASQFEYAFFDTPGQIEVFTWSASGTIIAETLSATAPTVVLFVVDTPRTKNVATFVSSMMYACSCLYKTNLPFLLVFNKIDCHPHETALEWMRNSELFEKEACKEQSYMATFNHSMSSVLEKFYAAVKCVGVSALTGAGFKELFEKISECREEYKREFLPKLRAKMNSNKSGTKIKVNSVDKLKKDLEELRLNKR